LARLHAIWGLGQLGRKQPNLLKALEPVLITGPDEDRAQAARVLGECRYSGAEPLLIDLLKSDNARGRFFAALALGQLCHRPDVGPLFELLRHNNDQDPFLRHAAVSALARIKDEPAVMARAADQAPAVRLGVLLVLRCWRDARIAQFLGDADPAL